MNIITKIKYKWALYKINKHFKKFSKIRLSTNFMKNERTGEIIIGYSKDNNKTIEWLNRG